MITIILGEYSQKAISSTFFQPLSLVCVLPELTLKQKWKETLISPQSTNYIINKNAIKMPKIMSKSGKITTQGLYHDQKN